MGLKLGNIADKVKEAQAKFDTDPLRLAYARTFTNPDGQEVLKDLRKQFYDCILTGPNSTELNIVAKAAEQDVIAVILKLIGDEK
mgnify:CR=1 FL=1